MSKLAKKQGLYIYIYNIYKYIYITYIFIYKPLPGKKFDDKCKWPVVTLITDRLKTFTLLLKFSKNVDSGRDEGDGADHFVNFVYIYIYAV